MPSGAPPLLGRLVQVGVEARRRPSAPRSVVLLVALWLFQCLAFVEQCLAFGE